MKKYRIKSEHTIHVDDYNEGEQEYINFQTHSAVLSAKNPIEAIKLYFEKELYLSLDIKCSDTNEDNLVFYYSNLVDLDNCEASERQIERWKKGELTLYSNSTSLTIEELIPIRIFLPTPAE